MTLNNQRLMGRYFRGLLLLFWSVDAAVIAQPLQSPPALQEPLQQILQRQLKQGTPTLLALEGPVDVKTYRVGPGDQFIITIGSTPPQVLTVEVNATGSLAIPEVGAIQAAGNLLVEVQDTTYRLLKQRYRHVPVDVSLSRPRTFYVHITGAVSVSGRFIAYATSRVSDILEQAFASNITDSSVSKRSHQEVPSTMQARLHPSYRPSLRNVRLRRASGAEQHLDLMRYYLLGDLDQNPYLHDGDVIEVPAFHINQDALFVYGEVAYPGIYDYRPGDTLLDILLLAAGGEPALQHIQNVRLTRRFVTSADSLQAELQEFSLGALLIHPETAPLLKPGDHVQIPARYQPYVLVKGAIQYPGSYPIVQGRTTLKELISMAGGLTTEASHRFAYIQRQIFLPSQTSMAATNADNVQSMRPFPWLLSQAANLDVFGRAYLTQSLQHQWLVVDLQAALESRGPNVQLFDGDRVFFPQDPYSVLVVGHIPRPGFVPYVPGQPARYYLQAAGGTGPRTRRIYVFNAETGAVQEGLSTSVASGDLIFVDQEPSPSRPELAHLAITYQISRRQHPILTIQTILAGISTIAGIITAYAAITR